MFVSIRHRFTAPLLALACAVLLPTIVHAAKQKSWNFAVDSPAEFEAQAAEIRQEMGTDGQYGAISVNDRKAVEADLERIEAILTSKDSMDRLNDQQKIDIVNAQERINAVLTKNDGNRLICTMEQRTGTKFKEKVCVTAKQREQIRDDAQKAYRDTLMKGGGTQQPGN